MCSIRHRIGQAAFKSGRSADSVRMIAVSKYYAVPTLQNNDGVVDEMIALGCTELGEARPQHLIEKAAYYDAVFQQNNADNPIRWHLIGTLQRNKVRKVLPAVTLIHSLDSLRLADAIERIAEDEQLTPVHCLLEVAISPDVSKQGVQPGDVLEVLDKLGLYKNIVVSGLMGMSGLESDEIQVRREYELLRLTAERVRLRGLPPNVPLRDLSMGMSDDFEIAIEEGATIVRIGSALGRGL